MRRLAVNVLAVLGVTILLLAGGALPAAPQALAAPQKDQSSGPLSSFGACLSGKGEGSLVLLMDQSGSLRQSDPEKARVKASKYLAQRLAAFADSSKVTLKVRVAGFASDYHALGDWVTINSGSLAEVDKQITAAGEAAAARYPGLTFWAQNWRKGGLSDRRNALIKEYNFYNQNYCGCEFSIRPESQNPSSNEQSERTESQLNA